MKNKKIYILKYIIKTVRARPAAAATAVTFTSMERYINQKYI